MKTYEFIEEFKQGKRSCYRIQRKDESGQLIGDARVVSCPLEFREKDGFVYALPHDNEMQVISNQYRFINWHHRGESENTRRAIAQALRLYNCFKVCFNLTDEGLTPDVIDMLLIFLCGYDYNPQHYRFITERDEATVRNQLSAMNQMRISLHAGMGLLIRLRPMIRETRPIPLRMAQRFLEKSLKKST